MNINKYTGKVRTDEETENAIEMVWIALHAGLSNKQKAPFWAERIGLIIQGW